MQAEPGNRQCIRLLPDGSPAAPDSKQESFDLRGINRGAYTLEAVVVKDKGEVVAVSGPVTFYICVAGVAELSRSIAAYLQ